MDDYSTRWFAFMEAARGALLKGQAINSYKQNIQFLFEPSFDNHISFQLQINDENVDWYRTTWLKLIDAPRFNDPIERLKIIGGTNTPTIQYDSGKIKIESISHILDLVKLLYIKPQFNKSGGFTLDGCYYTLTIGVESNKTTYGWHTVPDDWANLQMLADKLIELSGKLP